jgi:hypothetical protein
MMTASSLAQSRCSSRHRHATTPRCVTTSSRRYPLAVAVCSHSAPQQHSSAPRRLATTGRPRHTGLAAWKPAAAGRPLPAWKLSATSNKVFSKFHHDHVPPRTVISDSVAAAPTAVPAVIAVVAAAVQCRSCTHLMSASGVMHSPSAPSALSASCSLPYVAPPNTLPTPHAREHVSTTRHSCVLHQLCFLGVGWNPGLPKVSPCAALHLCL